MNSIKEVYSKIKYYVKRLNKTIRYVHNKTDNLCVFIFFDIIWCLIRYGSTDNEYRIFKFYNIDGNKRKTYMTKRKYKKYNRKLVDKEIEYILNDKPLLLARLKNYLKRDVYTSGDLSFKQFEEFAFDSKKVLARSKKNSFLNSFKIYDLNSFRSPAFMKDQMDKDNLNIVESFFNQHKSLNCLSDLVIINIVSVVNKKTIDLVTSTIKFKDNNKVISGYVDIDSGKVIHNLKDPNGKNYSSDYDGLVVPSFEKIITLTSVLAKELEEIRQIEWSYAVNSRGVVYLLDANVWDDYVFTQTPEFLRNKIGLMSYYKMVK